VVYLFSTNGTLLVTYTNPVPKTGGYFGENVVTVGNDLVFVGAAIGDNIGAGYLFNTNGVLLLTLTNPQPKAFGGFGYSAAAVGTDRLLVGAGYDDSVTNRAAAFLFRTDGMLLLTLTDPNPGFHMYGRAMTVAFDDKLLIGAQFTDLTGTNSGAVYVYSTNGTLIATFMNPTPNSFDNFGQSIAAVGQDRVLIGAGYNNQVGTAGVAYLFDSSGTLLSTFTSPFPVANGQFGVSLSTLGPERLLIGAPGDDDWTRAGATYLFSSNAVSLVTFTNPTTLPFPNQYLDFGRSLTAVGSDTLLIGSPADETGAMDAGAAYLFSIPPPRLDIRSTTSNVVAVSWLAPATGFKLQQNSMGLPNINWNDVTDDIQYDGTNFTLFVAPPTGNRFYRLSK
jgi:hypothetical protein